MVVPAVGDDGTMNSKNLVYILGLIHCDSIMQCQKYYMVVVERGLAQAIGVTPKRRILLRFKR